LFRIHDHPNLDGRREGGGGGDGGGVNKWLNEARVEGLDGGSSSSSSVVVVVVVVVAVVVVEEEIGADLPLLFTWCHTSFHS